MNEMLGNQYFLVRRFHEAAIHFEKTLLVNPGNLDVKKKLIICYVQLSEVKLALKLFIELISENIGVIINSNPYEDDCPCIQTISKIELTHINLTEKEKKTVLGILWLYCDIRESLKFFSLLLKREPQDSDFLTINNLLFQFNTRNLI